MTPHPCPTLLPEIWKSVPKYEGIYEASNMGEIRNVNTGRVLKPFITHGGYALVSLYKNGKSKSSTVHRIILETFVGEKPSINHCGMHMNGKSSDNRPENLQWGTYKENESHKTKHGTCLSGKKNPAVRLTKDQVAFARKFYSKADKSFNFTGLAKRFGVNKSTIWRAVRGIYWPDRAATKGEK